MGQLSDRLDEALSHGRRSGDQALCRDQALREQVAERSGSFGALNVDELAVRAEQVTNLQRAAHPQRVAHRTGVLADIARDLVRTLRRDVTTDWVARDDVRARIRSTIKRLLAK